MEDKVGRDGRMLTIADLPSADIKRWVIRRKAEVVVAVEGGVISLHDACERYRLTVEEFTSWQRAIHRYGVNGLRVTHAHEYRDTAGH